MFSKLVTLSFFKFSLREKNKSRCFFFFQLPTSSQIVLLRSFMIFNTKEAVKNIKMFDFKIDSLKRLRRGNVICYIGHHWRHILIDL